MANKKFYYRNKRKITKTEPSSEVAADILYTVEQLSRTLQDLGISEATGELLSKNRYNTAGDLVKHTEKDLYRIQGFNKKMLFEVKDALKLAEMSLRVEAPKPQTEKRADAAEQKSGKQQKPQKNQPVQKSQTSQKNQRDKSAQESELEVRSSKFGLADRRGDSKQKPTQNVQAPAKQTSAKPEKLTQPLPVNEWRKVLKGGKWGFSDGFKIVIPTMYDEVFCFKEGLASVEIDGKCGYIDSENNVVIPLDYDTAMSFSENYAMVVKGDKCGYINKNNEVVVPFEYDAATPFEDGEAKVKKDGKWATLTKDNKLTWI